MTDIATTQPSRSDLTECVLRAIDELNPQLPADQQLQRDVATRLFGRDAPLDSLGLVNLIVTVEEQLADELGIEVTLASDKAMSRRTSPFQSVESLIDFIRELLQESPGE